MGDQQPVPSWLQPPTGPSWPTRRVRNRELHIAIDVPAHWDQISPPERLPLSLWQLYHGPLPLECLSVHFMPGATLGSELANWVEAPLALTGFPLVEEVSQLAKRPELLQWESFPASVAVLEQLAADELCLYEGLAAMVEEGYRSLRRLYGVLARQVERAWKVLISLESACHPGMPEYLVQVNDHVRAASSFRAMTLLKAAV